MGVHGMSNLGLLFELYEHGTQIAKQCERDEKRVRNLSDRLQFPVYYTHT